MDILNNIRYGVELERAQMPDNGLNESPGLLNSILGTISGASQEGVDNKRNAIKNAAGERLLNQSGYTREELGLKPGQVLSDGVIGTAIRDYRENKQDARDTKAYERSLKPLSMQLEAQNTENRLQREQSADQFRTQLEAGRQQYAHQSKTQENRYAFEGEQARLDRSLERDLSNNSADMQMQIAQMNADLADKRMAYDRETKSMDRRDRAIAQLMAGLGQLGGAFSL